MLGAGAPCKPLPSRTALLMLGCCVSAGISPEFIAVNSTGVGLGALLWLAAASMVLVMATGCWSSPGSQEPGRIGPRLSPLVQPGSRDLQGLIAALRLCMAKGQLMAGGSVLGRSPRSRQAQPFLPPLLYKFLAPLPVKWVGQPSFQPCSSLLHYTGGRGGN